jgi:hypothetical protein
MTATPTRPGHSRVIRGVTVFAGACKRLTIDPQEIVQRDKGQSKLEHSAPSNLSTLSGLVTRKISRQELRSSNLSIGAKISQASGVGALEVDNVARRSRPPLFVA